MIIFQKRSGLKIHPKTNIKIILLFKRTKQIGSNQVTEVGPFLNENYI